MEEDKYFCGLSNQTPSGAATVPVWGALGTMVVAPCNNFLNQQVTAYLNHYISQSLQCLGETPVLDRSGLVLL